jgi:hypothetical protein
MDSPLSDKAGTLVRLRHAIWHGDWNDAETLAARLGPDTQPPDGNNLHMQLCALLEVLAAAKAARSEMLSSLGRLRAVAGFNNSGAESSALRHIFAATTDF